MVLAIQMAAVRSVAEAGGLNLAASHADGRPKNREYARLNYEALLYPTVLVTCRFWPIAASHEGLQSTPSGHSTDARQVVRDVRRRADKRMFSARSAVRPLL